MQRVRIGLTGLACVFVLVLLAAAFFGLVRPDEEAAGGDRTDAVAAKVEREPKEPLAELGVTPGGGTPKQAPASPPQQGQ